MASPRTSHNRKNGFALITALWVSVLIAVLTAGIIYTTRSHHAVIRHMSGTAEAKAIAEGGVYKAIHTLLQDPSQHGWQFGRSYALTIGSGQAEIRLANEAGKVDLHTADQDLLTIQLQTCGFQAKAARELSDQIIATRTDQGTDSAKPGFRSVSDLMPTLGITPHDTAALTGVFTAHSGRADPLAPFNRHVETGLTRWAQNKGRTDLEGTGSTVSGQRITVDHDLIEIHATGRTGGRAPYTIRAIVRLTRLSTRPFVILQWHRMVPPEVLRSPDDRAKRCTKMF